MNMITELNKFATLDALLEGLSKALNDKSIFSWKNPEDFNSLYEALASLSDVNETLRVISTLGRVEAALKKPLFSLDKASSLLDLSPDLDSLKDGDERYYATRFIKRFYPDWIRSWSMANVWSESGSEKARQLHMEILIGSSKNFELTLEELSKAGQSYMEVKQINESKVIARFLRVIKALRTACQSMDFECDAEVGKSIDRLIIAPFSHLTSVQIEHNARKDLIPDVVGLLLDLIGKRFSLAIESEHYAALKRLRKWCDDSAWREVSKMHLGLAKLSTTIAEALLILSRQNIADGELLKRLRDSVDSEYQFKRQCEWIAEAGHLDETIKAWLMAGGEHKAAKKTISSDLEISAKNEFSDIGDLLLRVQEGRSAIKIAEGALDDLELFDPALIPVITDLSNHWKIVGAIAEKMAHKRSVSLVGEVGVLIDIDRKLFDVVEEGTINSRSGTIVRSAVVVTIQGRAQVLKKGVVREIKE
jgi:hypothetical protein